MKKYFPFLFAIPISLAVFSLLFVAGCQREVKDPGTGIIIPPPSPVVVVNDNELVTGGVDGIVIDENNRPVVGATVNSGTNFTITDRYGVFRFSNINLSKANGTIKVVKPGYFTGFRSFISVAGRINNVRVKLLPKSNSGSFPASSGGTISLTSGGKLFIPAAAITDASGAAYSGTVNIAMTWIDPSSSDLPNIVIGDLRGVLTTGEERGLSTYGMLGVEMTGATGQVLKIATGKTADLTFPIPGSLQAFAPATIDLWHFDEVTARWKQEGIATKNGNNYIAQVAHFSFWNCDAPFPVVDLCMKLINNDNQPLINVQVQIKRVLNGTSTYGRTDSAGNLCGKVPKNEALVLQIVDQCGSVVYTQNIGPYTANTSLGNITVNVPSNNNLTITGTVTNCAGANVATGAAIIYVAGGNHYTVPVTNGLFTISMVRCSGSTLNFTVLGVDYSALQQSVPISGSGTTGTVNVGIIQACGSSSTEFIELLIDGSPLNFVSPPDNILAIDSVGPGVPYSFISTVYGSKQTAGSASSSIIFNFSNNAVAGILPLNYCTVIINNSSYANQIITVSPTVNITNFGPVATGFVEGNFNIQMNFSGTPKNVTCTFRARR